MTNFQATPQDISQAAASCDSTAQEIQGQLASLKSYVVGLEAWWGGIAANTFQELMALYDTYSAMLNQALTDIGSGLRGNFVNYTDSEHANLNKVNVLLTELQGANLG